MSKKCVICGKEIPKHRKNKDTCSIECASEKVAAWSMYIHLEYERLMKEAIKRYKAWKKV